MAKKNQYKTFSQAGMVRQAVARNIWKYREKHHLTQEELAARVGVDQCTVSEVENKKTQDIKLSNACKFAFALGMSLDEFTGFKTLSVEVNHNEE